MPQITFDHVCENCEEPFEVTLDAQDESVPVNEEGDIDLDDGVASGDFLVFSGEETCPHCNHLNEIEGTNKDLEEYELTGEAPGADDFCDALRGGPGCLDRLAAEIRCSRVIGHAARRGRAMSGAFSGPGVAVAYTSSGVWPSRLEWGRLAL